MTGKAGKAARWPFPKAAVLALAPFFPALPAFPVLPAVSAQTTAGSIVGPDSTPVSGVRVVLHRVGRTLQGPLDSMPTDRRGRFRFTFRPDTTALYLLSARYDGIEYFSSPVHTNPARPDTAIRILVYDTSSTTPVGLEARHLVVTRPGDDGSRSVLDLIVLHNRGRATRVAPDSLRPSWSGRVPRGTIGLELGESDVSPDAVERRGDSLFVTAPLAPGEKQLTAQYSIPSGREAIELPFSDSGATVNVLAEERGVTVSGGSLALADSQIIQGRSFRRWTGRVQPGASLRVTLPGTSRAPGWLLAALVSSIALVLAGAGWYLLSRRPATPARGRPSELLDALASLDARYLGREADTTAAEWSSYQTERALLKAQLEASLAARGPSR